MEDTNLNITKQSEENLFELLKKLNSLGALLNHIIDNEEDITVFDVNSIIESMHGTLGELLSQNTIARAIPNG